MHKKESELKQKATHRASPDKTTYCIRCGTCCKKGGPSLHRQDLNIILSGHIRRENLITLRKGELALSPISGRPEPIEQELVKIAGKGKGWVCCFFDEEGSSCKIYRHRPLECRLLKCWDTAELLSVISKDTIGRADIIGTDEPVLELLEIHEKECPVGPALDLVSMLFERHDNPESLAKLNAFIRHDLAVRERAVSEFGLSLEAELFLLGRPLFKILGARGLQPMK